MSETDAPPAKSAKPASPVESSFRAPEAMIAGMLLGSVGLGLLLIIFRNTDMEWSWEYWGSSDGTFNRSVIFRNFGLLGLALIALPLAIWRSWTAHTQARIANKQHALSEIGLIIDRFQKGAQMLESEDLSVRLAGIYALRELVLSDPDETYIMVLDLLCDFIREGSKKRQPDLAKVSKINPLPRYGPFPPDLQKAMEVMCRLRDVVTHSQELEKRSDWRANLEQAILSGTSLVGLNLSKVNLRRVKAAGMNLHEMNLSGALLLGADFQGSFLQNVKLPDASLALANLRRVVITESDLSRAKIGGANLSSAVMNLSNLAGAVLNGAMLSETVFSGCDMSDARLVSANLSNSKLLGSNLNRCVLDEAILSNSIAPLSRLCEASFNSSRKPISFLKDTWSYEGTPPTGLPVALTEAIAYRKVAEPWTEFAVRMTRERPDLGWDARMLVPDPEWSSPPPGMSEQPLDCA